MKRADIEVGKSYLAKVSGKLVSVQITEDRGEWYGDSICVVHCGWDAVNESTGRQIYIRSAARLREIRPSENRNPV